MVPSPRIELETHPYHGCVIPFNYKGNELRLVYKFFFFQIIALIFYKNKIYL